MNKSTEETEPRKQLVDDLACLVLAQLNNERRKSATLPTRADMAAIDTEQAEAMKDKTT